MRTDHRFVAGDRLVAELGIKRLQITVGVQAKATYTGGMGKLFQTLHHLSAQERSEKQRIMLSILRHDAEIRNLAEPWLADIDHMLGSETRFLH